MECQANANKANCSCTYMSCSRRGNCCACVSYHQKNNEIPGCFFKTAGEKTYDRSISNFVSFYS